MRRASLILLSLVTISSLAMAEDVVECESGKKPLMYTDGGVQCVEESSSMVDAEPLTEVEGNNQAEVEVHESQA